jgi:hypothetical protein
VDLGDMAALTPGTAANHCRVSVPIADKRITKDLSSAVHFKTGQIQKYYSLWSQYYLQRCFADFGKIGGFGRL